MPVARAKTATTGGAHGWRILEAGALGLASWSKKARLGEGPMGQTTQAWWRIRPRTLDQAEKRSRLEEGPLEIETSIL